MDSYLGYIPKFQSGQQRSVVHAARCSDSEPSTAPICMSGALTQHREEYSSTTGGCSGVPRCRETRLTLLVFTRMNKVTARMRAAEPGRPEDWRLMWPFPPSPEYPIDMTTTRHTTLHRRPQQLLSMIHFTERQTQHLLCVS